MKKKGEDSREDAGDRTKKRCRHEREERGEQKEQEEEREREAGRGHGERGGCLKSPCTSQKACILRSHSTERERKNSRKGEGEKIDESGFFSPSVEGSHQEMTGARETTEKKKLENFFSLRFLLLVLSHVKRVSEKVLIRLRHPIADREKMKKDILLNSICALIIYALSDLAAQKLQRIVKELEEKEVKEKQKEEETRRDDEIVEARKPSMCTEKNVGCTLENGGEKRNDEKEERRVVTGGERRQIDDEEEEKKKKKRMMEQYPPSSFLDLHHDGNVKTSGQGAKIEEDKNRRKRTCMLDDIAKEEEKGANEEEKDEESRESLHVRKTTEKDRLLKDAEDVDWRRTVSLALEGFLINGMRSKKENRECRGTVVSPETLTSIYL